MNELRDKIAKGLIQAVSDRQGKPAENLYIVLADWILSKKPKCSMEINAEEYSVNQFLKNLSGD